MSLDLSKIKKKIVYIPFKLCCSREGRKGIDVVNDHVENSLMREVDNIKGCQDRMKRTLEQVNHQLGANRYITFKNYYSIVDFFLQIWIWLCALTSETLL